MADRIDYTPLEWLRIRKKKLQTLFRSLQKKAGKNNVFITDEKLCEIIVSYTQAIAKLEQAEKLINR
jgi:hypothetical protein